MPPRKKNLPSRNDGDWDNIQTTVKETNSQQSNKKHMNSNPIKLVASLVVLLVILVLTFTSIKIVTIDGHQLGVKETWSQGVINDILQPKTYFLFPGWSQTVFKYDASSRVYVMNDKAMAAEGKNTQGREKDSYLVQSQEGQDMKISMNLRWRIDPAKLISMHKTVREDIEEKLIRPTVLRVVKDEATRMKAIDAYSGEGLVKLQTSIQNALAGGDAVEGAELKNRGVIVENFVIEHIALDPAYVAEIVKKQIAVQQQLRAIEEQKAAEAEALVAKAKAQADLNTQVVGGKRDAELVVIKATAAQEQVIIAAKAAAEQVTIAAKAAATQVTVAAEAQKQQMTLEGEGKKAQMTATADGTLAMGKAEAAAKQLLLASWNAAGTNAYVQVEVAKALSSGIQGIQGYLPNNINPTILSDSFVTGVKALMGTPPVAAAVAK